MTNDTHITNVFKVLQDPIRFRIIEMLQFDSERRKFLPDTSKAKEGFCPEDILMVLREEGIRISNTKLSYHLKELREAHIIYLVKEGKRNFYLFNDDGLETIQSWLKRVLKK
ncbi:helix-turn-helix domain-containing protein [Shimazuella sp. KC615]|uniref:Helix-turn-helix domain-containing protein n=2 Tax=Shimazuella alba TaxID=2690964 RepID=A0A6I4VWK7_9BACL|nr:helix-turn-helix domain-containing protein [Shimazuella alba]MXQ54226.1 helix-turn-helix domain-containing protein [Shimazuella alba]